MMTSIGSQIGQFIERRRAELHCTMHRRSWLTSREWRRWEK